MSSNNFLQISKKKDEFIVRNVDMDTGKGFIIGRSKDFKEAREIAYYYQKENEVEYSIRIAESCFLYR